MLLRLVTFKLFELKQPLFESEREAIGCFPLQGNDVEGLIDGGVRGRRKAIEERERENRKKVPEMAEERVT